MEFDNIVEAHPDQMNTPSEEKWIKLRELFLNEHPDYADTLAALAFWAEESPDEDKRESRPVDLERFRKVPACLRTKLSAIRAEDPSGWCPVTQRVSDVLVNNE